MSKVSIVIPAYNASKYIEKCLDSVINQTLKDIEVVLINDGSKDNTEEVIKPYLKDKRIKYFKNKNQGIGKTRNFGIEKATGKYIMFLDSDDYLDLEACEKCYNKCEKENLDQVVFNFYRVENDNLNKETIEEFKTSNLKNNKKLINIINLGPCNKMYKKEIIDNNKIKFEENIKYEDVPLVIDTIKYSKNIGYINEYLHYYVIHGNSETTVRDDRIFDILKIIDLIRNKLKEENVEEELNKLTVRMITNYTIQQRNQIDIKTGIKFIEEAFSYLEKEVPDYKNNKYYKDRGIYRRTIEKNKFLTKIYCKIYRLIKG